MSTGTNIHRHALKKYLHNVVLRSVVHHRYRKCFPASCTAAYRLRRTITSSRVRLFCAASRNSKTRSMRSIDFDKQKNTCKYVFYGQWSLQNHAVAHWCHNRQIWNPKCGGQNCQPPSRFCSVFPDFHYAAQTIIPLKRIQNRTTFVLNTFRRS